MAKIHAEYDTKDKTLSVTQDGKAMPNVHHVEFGRSYDSEDNDENPKHICHIAMREKNKDEGYSTHTHVVANEQGDLVAQTEQVADPKLSQLIGGYLNRGRVSAKKKQ